MGTCLQPLVRSVLEQVVQFGDATTQTSEQHLEVDILLLNLILILLDDPLVRHLRQQPHLFDGEWRSDVAEADHKARQL